MGKSHFCLNSYQCGKDMKFGVCALDDLHMSFDVTLDHFKAKNVQVHSKQIKCCLDLDGGSDSSEMAMALLANNTRALDLSAGDSAAEMKSWSAFMAGAGAGGAFVASWSALAFLAYLRCNRRRSFLNVNTMLG